jgi:hypothetical protein
MKGAGAALLVVGLIPTWASAQQWTEYSYPAAGFAVQLPRAPEITSGTYKTAAGVSLPSMHYEVRDDGILYTLDIVDYSGSRAADSDATIAEAEKTVSAAGRVNVALDARVNREYGRELSISGADGSRSTIAIFFVNGHLYLLDGKSLPPDALARSSDAIRFQESLQFIGEVP